MGRRNYRVNNLLSGLFGHKSRKACREVGDKILGVLESGVETKQGTLKGRSSGHSLATEVDRYQKTFETAPGVSHPEKLQSFQHGGEGFISAGLQYHPEQAGCPAVIPFPYVMSRTARQCRVHHPCDLGLLREPVRQGHCGGVMSLQTDGKGTEASQCEITIIRGRLLPEAADGRAYLGPGVFCCRDRPQHDI